MDEKVLNQIEELSKKTKELFKDSGLDAVLNIVHTNKKGSSVVTFSNLPEEHLLQIFEKQVESIKSGATKTKSITGEK